MKVSASELRVSMPTVGLVGCGNWGANILRDLLALQCGVIVADTSAIRRERATALGASAVCDQAGALPECDGYVVAVPIPLLAEISALLLPRGRPVFAEKTLCLSLESADRLAALGGNDRLFAMHKWRYHPGIEALRVASLSGSIGRVEEIRLTRQAWVPDLHGGDVFWTQAVHDLTIVLHILGYIPPPERVWARLENNIPISLTAVLAAPGLCVTLNASARHPVRLSVASVHGSAGAAALPDASAHHILLRGAGGQQVVPVDKTLPLFLELREFIEHLCGGPRPRCSLEEARQVTASILAMRQEAGLPGGSPGSLEIRPQSAKAAFH